MPRREAIYYCDTEFGATLISAWNDKQAQKKARRNEGSHLNHCRPATQADVDWVRAMGGYVPDNCVIRRPPKEANKMDKIEIKDSFEVSQEDRRAITHAYGRSRLMTPVQIAKLAWTHGVDFVRNKLLPLGTEAAKWSKHGELPELPSQCVRAALADLALIEIDPRYTVDMGDWHSPNGHCAVCFGGAVMAKRLDADVGDHLTPEDFNDPVIGRKLGSLDHFRQGEIENGLRRFYGLDWSWNGTDEEELKQCPVPESEWPEDICVEYYEDDPKQFRLDMEAVAQALEEVGL